MRSRVGYGLRVGLTIPDLVFPSRVFKSEHAVRRKLGYINLSGRRRLKHHQSIEYEDDTNTHSSNINNKPSTINTQNDTLAQPTQTEITTDKMTDNTNNSASATAGTHFTDPFAISREESDMFSTTRRASDSSTGSAQEGVPLSQRDRRLFVPHLLP
jgi:hypothetical protein